MKRTMLVFSLLLLCTWGGVISALAEDFKPVSGTKYLIKCKNNSHFACYNSSSLRGSNDKGIDANAVILSHATDVTENCEFTIEYSSENEGYYIKSSTAENLYVYAVNQNDQDSNVGIKEFETPDATCIWTISYNKDNDVNNDQVYGGFNIKPKGGSNGWNCRSANSTPQIGQWSSNNTNDNLWYFIPSTNLPSGYYTLKNKATNRYTNYFNDFTYEKNPNGYTMGSSSLPSPLKNGYIWHVTNNQGVLSITNGQGGDAFKTDNGTTTSTLTVAAYTDGSYIFDPVLNAGNSTRPIGDYQRLTTWAGGGSTAADNLWNFNYIDGFNESNIYNVVVDNASGYVTYTSTNESAKNGGFFYLSNTPQVSDFTAAEITNHKTSISIEGNTITVNYTLNANGLKAKAEQVESEVLSKTGVGYPTSTCDERTKLATAIANAKVATDDNVDELNTILDAAVQTYLTMTSNIQMPEDGKAYRIACVYNDGVKQYLYWNGSRIAANQDDQVSDKNTSIFICHEVNGKYLFATNQGTYLSWMDNGNVNKSYNTKGVTDSYISQNDWTLEPADVNANQGTITVSSRTEFFGRLQMKALDKNGNNLYYLDARHAKDNATQDADFIAGTAGSKYYDSGWDGRPRTHTFVFEEATYPNEVTFASTNGSVEGADYIATFSAPFATIIPENISAYIVKVNGETANTTKLNGEAIPANTGILLVSTTGDKVRMVPAADETQAEATDNELGNSAGASLTLTAGNGYILGKRNDQVAFYLTAAGTLPMNRAYLRKASDQSVQSIKMSFAPTTGINEANAAVGTNNGTTYDLTGRRVIKVVKGGVYIKNGQKFIVK